ncbi:MAG TPA: carbohydrate kinase family protein [Streptosporangiaceae bacterium]
MTLGGLDPSARVLVLGDLCVDTIVSAPLPITWSGAAAISEPLLQVPIADRIGGTAYQFARAAARHGLRPTLVGCVGEDPAGDLIINELASRGLDHHIQRSPSAPTARSVLAFDAMGARLMFTSSVNANDQLSVDFGPVCADHPLKACWLSGMCLRSRNAARFRTVIEGVAHARSRGAMILLDLVPHTFHRLFSSLHEVMSVLGGLDGVVADLAAARKMLDLPASQETTVAVAMHATAEALVDIVPFAVLQWHDAEHYLQLAVSRSGFTAAATRPVPQGIALVGYGDALAAEAVRDYLAHSPATPGPSRVSTARGECSANATGESR